MSGNKILNFIKAPSKHAANMLIFYRAFPGVALGFYV